MMLESFINAQKFSVQRSLRRQFTRYLDADVDHTQIILATLRNIIRENQTFAHVSGRGRDGVLDATDIKVDELEARVSRHGIARRELEMFWASAAFKEANFSIDRERSTISVAFGV